MQDPEQEHKPDAGVMRVPTKGIADADVAGADTNIDIDDETLALSLALSLDEPAPIRVLEALLFAATEPVAENLLVARLGAEANIPELLAILQRDYAGRGFNLVCTGGRWWFRTAPDLAAHLNVEDSVSRKLSRAAIETLAIVAYHQPVTRAEIESIRGVATSKGTLDLLMEAGWIRPGRRRETPGRPLTWVTTERFLDHFSLESLRDLPGIEELKAAGLLDTRPVFGAAPE